MTQKTDNIWILLIVAFYSFVLSVGKNLKCLILGPKEGKDKNIDYKNLNAIIKQIPSSWANHPTGIGIGRGIFITLLYFFRKHVYCNTKK